MKLRNNTSLLKDILFIFFLLVSAVEVHVFSISGFCKNIVLKICENEPHYIIFCNLNTPVYDFDCSIAFLWCLGLKDRCSAQYGEYDPPSLRIIITLELRILQARICEKE